MFGSHKVATSIGAIGAAVIAGHAVLGPSVVPVVVALAGVALAAAAGLYLAIAHRRSVRAGK
jgi:hypothetical protein